MIVHPGSRLRMIFMLSRLSTACWNSPAKECLL